MEPTVAIFRHRWLERSQLPDKAPVLADSGRRIGMIFNMNCYPFCLMRRHYSCETDKEGWRESVRKDSLYEVRKEERRWYQHLLMKGRGGSKYCATCLRTRVSEKWRGSANYARTSVAT